MTLDPAARGWLDRPELARLWDAAHARLQNNGLSVRGRLPLAAPSDAERTELQLLMGRTYSRPDITVDLPALDDRLPGGLVETVRALRGPLRDRRDGRATAQRERERLWSGVGAALAATGVSAEPWAEAWVAEVRQGGSLARLPADTALTLMDQAAAVLAALTATTADLGRHELAARHTGSAHGLDDDRLLSRLVLRALAHRHGTALPRDARARRELWALAGAAPDTVSATVLVYGLAPEGDDLAARTLRTRLGAETHLTARDLRTADWRLAPGLPVHVCENPRVLQAAAESSRPGALVCTSGNANTTVTALLDHLARQGAALHFRGDFDWPGITMVNRLVARYTATTWRMSAHDYETHAATAQAQGTPLNPLSGPPVEATWDPELTPAMRSLAVTVEEESALNLLLSDLL